jgi:hypothetical protein
MAIFTAIGTAVAGALFAGSALAATVISTGLAFAARIGMQYLNRPKARKYSAVQGETQYGGDISAQTLYGTGKTKGQRVFYAKWDKGNRWNADVFLLANGWCDGLEPYIYVFGEKKSLISQPTVGGETARYFVEDFLDGPNGMLVLRFHDGRPGQPVDQRLVDVSSDLGQKWKTTSVNAGICYVVVERRWSEEFFGTKGKPEIEFVLRGLREYDPRKDSTVAGGSGSQRLADPSTWRHTLNPAVHRLNYQLGLRALVSGRTLIGEGKSIGQLDLATYFLSMNVCDTLRTDGKKQYQCSLFVTGDDDHTEVLREFEDAMAGYGLNRRGLSGVIPGAPQIPVMEITAADIPSDRAKDIQFRKSAFTRFNHLSGQFLSKESMWNPESLKPVYVNADIAADGRNRQTSNDFLQVTDPDIAQYLLNIRYRQNRKGATATLPVSRRVGMRLQEGEWIVWRGREWMIQEWKADDKLRITLDLTETGADIYDDDDIEPGPIVIPPTPPMNPSVLSTVQNFTVEAWLIKNDRGYQEPALRFRWTPPDDPTIVAVRIEYQAQTDGSNVSTTSCPNPDAGEFIITTNVLPTLIYQAHATISTVPDRFKTWTPYATTTVATGSIQITVDQLAAEIKEDLETLQGWIDEDFKGNFDQVVIDLSSEIGDRVSGAIENASRYRSILDEMSAIRDYAADQDFANYRDKEQLRQAITARVEGGFASFDERITVAASNTSAVSQRVTTLEASTSSIAAQITDIDEAIVEGDLALAQQISLLSAGTDNQFDPVNLWDFEVDASGWTGNGAPTVASGFLRPATVATNPYVASPIIEVMGSKYRQVRLRIRKVGSPVWEGGCWWKASADTTWDTARRAVVAEPSFDANGIGLITFNPEWSGTIVQIRIDLSSTQTETDYFTIDWVSIGAPSPGASRAELAAERLARIDRDEAIASSLVALEAKFNDPETGLGAVATGVSVLEARVTDNEGLINAQATSLDALAVSLNGKAGIDVVNELSAEVEALGGGGLVSQGGDIRAVRNEIWPLASETIEQDFANFLGTMGALKVTADASDVLDTKITLTNNSIDIVARAVTQVQSVLPGLATSTALSALSTRVTAAEGNISSASSAITSLQSDLGSLTTVVGTKASASALTALTTRVSSAEANISSASSAITSLQSDLGTLEGVVGTKASASALTALTTRVSTAEGEIEAVSDSLSTVTSRVDDVSADARFRMTATSGPTGFARIAAQARVSSGAGWRTAGWYMDVPTDMSEPTQFLVNADRFAILNGSSKKQPFVFEGGELTLAIASIGTVKAGLITSPDGKMTIDINAGTIVIKS